MWKSLRITLILLLLAGTMYFASITPLRALDMNPDTAEVTIYVMPLVAPTVTNGVGASNVGSTTARLNGEVTSTGNENPTAIVYYGLTDGGENPASWDDNVTLGIKALGSFYYDASGLAETTLHYYRMYAENSGGFDWADSSENFTTLEQCEPPTGLTLTDQGYVTVTADWTLGLGTTYTMLRGLRSGYPTSITDGELIYYGPDSSVNSTGYALDVSAYYVSAWGFLADNVTSSSGYATATIGGEGMTDMANALTSIAAAFTAIGGYIEYGIGIIFVLWLLTIADKRRETSSAPVVYMISGLIGFFVALTWLDNYMVIAFIVMFLAVYQWFEAIVIAMSSGGPSRGISQFKGVIDSVKGWFD